MDLPESLAEWNLDTVKDLLQRGVKETNCFDFKEKLPHSKNRPEKGGLVKDCAAFANSGGGFLIFGVKDCAALPAFKRLVGLPASYDFPRYFGAYPARCEPAINNWDFSNPPISLPRGKVIHVVHIPQSWEAPHAVGDAHRGWVFPKRTNQGNDEMSYSEVRLMFLGYYEKRLKLQLLSAELDGLLEEAKNLAKAIEARHPRNIIVPVFDLRILETVHADTYSITHSRPEFARRLLRIRQTARTARERFEIAKLRYARDYPGRSADLRQYHKALAECCGWIIKYVNATQSLLAEILR